VSGSGDLSARIMARLRGAGEVQTADEIAAALRVPRADVLRALHDLQDSSDVYLTGGFYRPSPLHWSRFGVHR
jgi:predicted ArsR family transcriptional regulator